MIAASFLPISDPGQPWIFILYASAILLAVGVILRAPGLIWNRIVKRFAKSVVEVDTVSQLAKVAPDLILLSKMGPTIYQMAEQFTTNSGSSLRDVINRLEESTNQNSQALAAMERSASTLAAKVIDTADVLALKVSEDAGALANVVTTTADKLSMKVAGDADVLSLAVAAVARLSAADRENLHSLLGLAESSDATVARIEATNPVAPAPKRAQ